MTKFEHSSAFTRRSVLLGGGALVVSVGAAVSLDTLLSLQAAYAQGAKPPLTPDQLSSYIAVNADGTVSAFFGKMDMGHGLHVAIAQIVADELDVPFKSVKVFMGDTANSVNQGGASGSTGIQYGGKQMRIAAAEARRVLVEMASALLSTPVEQLKVQRRRRDLRRRCNEAHFLRADDWWKIFQRPTRLEQTVRQYPLRAGQSAAQETERA
ncbi:MAG: molybdopterin cofactor-binding domain-containing protein [Pseudolabrys sp.]